MRYIQFSILILISLTCHSQSIIATDSIQPPSEIGNIHLVKVDGDTLSSSFIIFISDNVPLHRHLEHSEQVYILEGKGLMTLGDMRNEIKEGDLIFIPKNTWHSVQNTGSVPLKVISIQSPKFDGSDREFYKNQ